MGGFNGRDEMIGDAHESVGSLTALACSDDGDWSERVVYYHAAAATAASPPASVASVRLGDRADVNK